MPLSTSNSDRPGDIRASLWASVALIALAAIYLVGTDTLFRLGVPRISKIERRISTEYAEAIQVGATANLSPSVLVLGNSLLGEGVRFDRFKRELQPECEPHRLLIEDTTYFDWYYGLRRLYAAGSRPNTVILVLNPTQLQATRVRGEYFAYHLMNGNDVLSVARDVNLTNTQTSNLAFAHYSGLIGLGAQVRNVVLSRICPDLPQLMSLATRTSASRLLPEALYKSSARRLTALRELTARHGSRFILVVPPQLGEEARIQAETIQRAGHDARVPVLVPLPPGSLTSSSFSDGFHLNADGAEVFTGRFIEMVRSAILDTKAWAY